MNEAIALLMLSIVPAAVGMLYMMFKGLEWVLLAGYALAMHREMMTPKGRYYVSGK